MFNETQGNISSASSNNVQSYHKLLCDVVSLLLISFVKKIYFFPCTVD